MRAAAATPASSAVRSCRTMWRISGPAASLSASADAGVAPAGSVRRPAARAGWRWRGSRRPRARRAASGARLRPPRLWRAGPSHRVVLDAAGDRAAARGRARGARASEIVSSHCCTRSGGSSDTRSTSTARVRAADSSRPYSSDTYFLSEYRRQHVRRGLPQVLEVGVLAEVRLRAPCPAASSSSCSFRSASGTSASNACASRSVAPRSTATELATNDAIGVVRHSLDDGRRRSRSPDQPPCFAASTPSSISGVSRPSTRPCVSSA